MNNKIILFGVVLLLLLGSFFWFSQNKKSSGPASHQMTGIVMHIEGNSILVKGLAKSDDGKVEKITTVQFTVNQMTKYTNLTTNKTGDINEILLNSPINTIKSTKDLFTNNEVNALEIEYMPKAPQITEDQYFIQFNKLSKLSYLKLGNELKEVNQGTLPTDLKVFIPKNVFGIKVESQKFSSGQTGYRISYSTNQVVKDFAISLMQGSMPAFEVLDSSWTVTAGGIEERNSKYEVQAILKSDMGKISTVINIALVQK